MHVECHYVDSIRRALAPPGSASSQVPAVFAAVTVVFLAIFAIAKTRKQSNVVVVARRQFIQDGYLGRPSVMRSIELEAILRGWLTPRAVTLLLFTSVLTSNSFVGLLFRWAHEHLVFTQADKAFLLYNAILSTFLVQAFLADVDPESSSGPGFYSNFSDGGGDDTTTTTTTTNTLGTWESNDVGFLVIQVFIGAFFANLFLFPIKYVRPAHCCSFCLTHSLSGTSGCKRLLPAYWYA